MRVDWLSLLDFRSYEALEWKPDASVNLLMGANGAGKTNLLEAIGYLGNLKSFRSVPDSVLIREGADAAVVRSGIESLDRSRLIEVEIPRNGSRRAQVDKTRLRRSSDLLGAVRVIAFLPEDLDLVKRGPAHRRDLLDDIAIQLWPAAYLDQAEFDRALRQRNAFLKSGDRDDVTLSVWDSRLSQAAGRVVARRQRVMETLSHYLANAYADIAAADVEAVFTYRTSWGAGSLRPGSAGEYASALAESLEASRGADYERRMTTVGPHRDEPGFSIEGREVRTHASQGEQRSTALAVKLAAHRAVREAMGEPPVLLLDDVFSELDPVRAAALAEALPASTQILITSARPEDVPLSGSVWQVSGGSISG